jgi:hypothetical protein
MCVKVNAANGIHRATATIRRSSDNTLVGTYEIIAEKYTRTATNNTCGPVE